MLFSLVFLYVAFIETSISYCATRRYVLAPTSQSPKSHAPAQIVVLEERPLRELRVWLLDYFRFHQISAPSSLDAVVSR